MIKIRVSEIRSCGRSTQGVRLINLGSGDGVASLARIPKAEAPSDAPMAKPKKIKDVDELLGQDDDDIEDVIDEMDDIEEEEIVEGEE